MATNNIGNVGIQMTFDFKEVETGTKKVTEALERVNQTAAKTTKGTKDTGAALKEMAVEADGAFKYFTQLERIAARLFFAKFALDTFKAASAITQFADQIKISTQDVQRFQTVFERNGNNLEDIRRIYERLQKSAVSAATGNDKLNSEFIKLGINVDKFLQLSQTEKMEKLAMGLSRIVDPAERAAAAEILLERTSGKTLAALQEIADKGSIQKATDGIILNSTEALNAMDDLKDGAVSLKTSFQRLATEIIGTVAISMKELGSLQQKYQTTNAFTMQGMTTGTGGGFRAAVDIANKQNAPTPLDIEVKRFEANQRMIQAAKDAAELLALQAENQRKLRDAVMASVDPISKYNSEVDKANHLAKENKLSEEDRLKLIASISNTYIYAIDPVRKYADEVAKINADKGLNDIQKRQNIELLNKSYVDIYDPAKRYKDVIKDTDGLVKALAMTETEQAKVIRNLSISYRELIDPLTKYQEVQKKLDAIPDSSMSQGEKLTYLRSLSDGYTKIIYPATELARKLKELSALKGISLFGNEPEAIKAILQEEYAVGRLIEKTKLSGDAILEAQAKYAQTSLEIKKAFIDSAGGAEDLAIKTQAANVALRDLFIGTSPYFVQATEYVNGFADSFANAIVAGQSFGDAFKNVFQDVLKQIAAMIIRTTILQAIMASIGFISPTSGAASAFGKLVGINPTTGLAGKASGGSVSANTPYMVGENGPEQFIPATSGFIVPNGMSATGGGTTVVQNISIQTGVAQTVRAEMAALLPSFKQQAIAGVAEAKQRGGSYARVLSAA